jgi:hypothetical protein
MIKIGGDRDADNVFKILHVPCQRTEFLDKQWVSPLAESLHQLGPVGEIVVTQGADTAAAFANPSMVNACKPLLISIPSGISSRC